ASSPQLHPLPLHVAFPICFLLLPLTRAQANPMCPGEPAPVPESAGSGADGLLVPPQSQSAIEGAPDGLPPDARMYGQYGTAGTRSEERRVGRECRCLSATW